MKFEKANYKKNMITQMTQPVKRVNDVLLERAAVNSSGSGSFTVRVSAQGT